MEALGSVEVQLRKVLSTQRNIVTLDSNDSLKHVPILKRIYKLQQKYSVWLTLSDYYSSKELVLKNFIDRLASGECISLPQLKNRYGYIIIYVIFYNRCKKWRKIVADLLRRFRKSLPSSESSDSSIRADVFSWNWRHCHTKTFHNVRKILLD